MKLLVSYSCTDDYFSEAVVMNSFFLTAYKFNNDHSENRTLFLFLATR
jgi:hypothetical protein